MTEIRSKLRYHDNGLNKSKLVLTNTNGFGDFIAEYMEAVSFEPHKEYLIGFIRRASRWLTIEELNMDKLTW